MNIKEKMPMPSTKNKFAPGTCKILQMMPIGASDNANAPLINANFFIEYLFRNPTHMAFRKRPVFLGGFWTPLLLIKNLSFVKQTEW